MCESTCCIHVAIRALKANHFPHGLHHLTEIAPFGSPHLTREHEEPYIVMSQAGVIDLSILGAQSISVRVIIDAPHSLRRVTRRK